MKMEQFFRAKSLLLEALLLCCLHLLNLNSCFSLNDEGVALLRLRNRVASDPEGALSNWIDKNGVETPCCWFGVECSKGHVVALNLKDLRLSGTLPPEMGNLLHANYIILRNNSFSGVIPEEMANLRQLRVLDLRHNNFSGHLHNYFSPPIVLLDNDQLLSTTTTSSTSQLVISRSSEKTGNVGRRKLRQDSPSVQMEKLFWFPPPSPESTLPPPNPVPAPETAPAPLPPATKPSSPSPSPSSSSPPSPVTSISPSHPPGQAASSSGHHHHRLLIVSAAAGGPLLLLLIIGIYFWRSGKVSTVKPWATGLSGQLQRAFITGVPRLKRYEVEAACEDFSNVIGSASLCSLYKGTLSSGVEIAVASIAVGSSKQWSTSMEAHFRNKIDTLSKVNHKNFASLLGYCVEEQPFTRMMVFEYAPNGTLFEHLHIREAEHLEWATRMRIAMGMAYCLDHMHQMLPPFIHRNFKSSAVYLTEDYAAKVSDFAFSDDETRSARADAQSNVYSFGVVLYEMITGKLPYTAGSDSPQHWASDYLSGLQCLREMVDPTLETYGRDELQRIGGVITSCTEPEPRRRPTMKEVCAQLREITGIEPEVAVPRLSPLWWAELEILST
ncbi:inactive receptor-like serine/threonine-protein kinase At2g40270 isoform X3 [Salvia miltiorrhiza]|uniref:inactive receptor-like serine/threonine-protein kinase At2g40270 isoform X3 n=1 Tax=Salvia miltiorrhiza TaxID=226208 RepID=UPI0025AB681D|nr:inactive receptor-like serine/threonine-protein kinase At2g40270 isoform X3 [Salvia miltiorrhiza]XP_057804648.1 inactive receptor-like serine/threonine-protein kinase At2g40270 isoform X3 [Salvia miltiorrhiza]